MGTVFPRRLLAAAMFVWAGFAATPALADPPLWPYPDGAPGFIPCPTGVIGVSCTASSSHHETDIRVDLPNAQAYSTRVFGYAYLTGPGLFQDIIAFDQTTANAPGSATVLGLFDQATLAAHNAALALAAGRPFVALMETGPELVTSSSTTGAPVQISHASYPANPVGFSYTVTLGSDVYTIVPPNNASSTFSGSITVGPGTVLVGPDQTFVAFIPAGTLNLNYNLHSELFFEDDFQATTTNTAVYQSTAHIILQLVGTIHPAVQSAALGSGSDFLHRLGKQSNLGDTTDDPPPRAWAEGYGLWSHDRAQGMVPGNDASTGGIAGGLNVSIAPGLSLGFGADHGRSRIDESAVFEHADLDLTQIGLNAAYASNDWSFSAAVTGGIGTVDALHGTAALGGVSSAAYDIQMLGASTEAGYRVLTGGWSLTPKLGFDWISVDTDAFTETGGLTLIAGEHTASRTRAWLGLTVAHGLDIGERRLDLSATARVIDVLQGRARSLPVDFAGSPLHVDGLTEGRYAGDLEVRAAMPVADNALLFVAGQGALAEHGDYAFALRAGFTINL